jgi:cobyrinic acid a,c-diamide synthase
MTAHGIVVSAPGSGMGKTTVTLALVAALKRRGVKVRLAKAGPDYIDPAYHAAAAGSPSVNLDTWAMKPPLVDALVAQSAAGVGLLVIEGVMGLFDGIAGEGGRTGATADLVRRYGLPVLLVVDVGGQAQSAAAVVRGFATHDDCVPIAGVVLNRVASERHRVLVSEAIAALGIAVLGAMPRDGVIAIPERHLGLVQASEQSDLAARLERLADMAERYLDLEAILAAAAPIGSVQPAPTQALLPPGRRIALAFDAAFSFIYPHLLDGWRRAGAEVVTFSPLADEPPPDECDCCWLPGGYPELHASALMRAGRFRAGLARFANTRRVHGECGGYMVLGKSIEDADGACHAMTGLLGHATSLKKRRLQLGYREARLLRDSSLGLAGVVLRGHEFHYATLVDIGHDETLAELADATGRPLGKAGGCRGNVTGTFFHAIALRDRP